MSEEFPTARQWLAKMQFSLLGLLGLVAFVGVGCAALINASELWASLMFTGTLAVLMVGILRSVFCRGSARAFWLGFVVFGWGYLLWLAHLPNPDYGQGMVGNVQQPTWWLQEEGLLATTKLLDFTYWKLLPLVRTPPAVPPGMGGGGTVGPYTSFPLTPGTAATFYPLRRDFMRVGHSLWMLVVAFLGGKLARYFYGAERKKP